jgi:hypothetical protein
MRDESEKTISDADRARANKLRKKVLGEGFKNLSAVDAELVQKVLDTYMNRNDGGIAKKTRNF